MNIKKLQEMLYEQYLRDEKDKIFNPHEEVGDIAELGLVGEELGEAMIGIRKKLGLGHLKEECGDILVRTLNFMSRKGIDAESALALVHAKNVRRNRKGLFIEGQMEDELVRTFSSREGTPTNVELSIKKE